MYSELEPVLPYWRTPSRVFGTSACISLLSVVFLVGVVVLVVCMHDN